MSVVFDRRLMLAFLTAWDVFCLCLTDPLDCFWLVQKDNFYLADYSGLACRPADINLLVGVFLCPRASNPGWGDWSRSFCVCGVFCCFFLLYGQVNVSAFACNATGLDAVQRWEQKKIAGAALGAPDAAFAWQVQHLESLGAASGQRLPSRFSTRCTGCCFCVAGAALREPGPCLWSMVSAGPRTLLRGRCSTRYSRCCFCVVGAALREPGRCLWSTVSAGPRCFFLAGAALGAPDAAFMRGRCNT